MGDITKFAKNLKSIREKRGLKQTELAEKIGVTPQTISAYEKGGGDKGKNPTLEKIIDIANVLDVSLDELCGRDIYNRTSKSKLKTLGDVARLLCDMWDWDTVIFSEQEITKWNHYEGVGSEAYEVNVPAIVFSGGPLEGFLEGFSKLKKLREDCIIDEQMFTDWITLKIRDLDGINIETQNKLVENKELPRDS